MSTSTSSTSLSRRMVVKPDCSWIKNLQEEVASLALTAAGARTIRASVANATTTTGGEGGGEFSHRNRLSSSTSTSHHHKNNNNDTHNLRLAEKMAATDTALSKQMPMRLVYVTV